MTISIQMILIVGVPFLLIYTALVFSYSYRKGFEEGFDLAENYAELMLDHIISETVIEQDGD